MTTPDTPLLLPAAEGHAVAVAVAPTPTPTITKPSAPIEMPAALRPWRR
jgi:hypothetical protein